MSLLQGRLQESPLAPRTRQNIIRHLWTNPLIDEAEEHELDWGPYFDYYENQCHHALHEQGTHILVRTHQQIIDIAHKLEQGQSRETIKTDLSTQFTAKKKPANEEEVLNNSIDLAARLSLMINFGVNEATVTQGVKLLWNTPSLKDFVWSYFNTAPVLSNNNIRFEKVFTAFNMERIADMKIRWTNNLADHLRMVNDDEKIIAVFHHVSFLKRQRNNVMFPPGFIDETLRTTYSSQSTTNSPESGCRH